MRLFLTIAAASTLLASAAAAQQAPTSATGTVTIDGSVAGVCVMGPPSPASIDLGQMATTTGVRTGKINNAISVAPIALDGTFCNYGGTHLTVSATALTEQDSSPVASGFDKAVNFTANVSGWTTSAASVTTNAAADGTNPTRSANGGSQGLPNSANLTLVLTGFTTPGDGMRTAGAYQGAVTITVGPDAVD